MTDTLFSFFQRLLPSWLGVRRTLLWGYWVGVVLAGMGLVWGLWYANTRGLTKHWRGRLVAELARRGIHTSVGRLTWSPLRGFVARDVRFFQDSQRRWMLARVDRVVIELRYARLLAFRKASRGEPVVASIDLADANASIPLEPGGGRERLEVANLNARVVLSPGGRLELEHANALIRGLRVEASGALRDLDQFQPVSADSGDAAEDPLSKLTERLRVGLQGWDKREVRGGAPRLEIHFEGDLSVPSGLRARARLSAGAFTVRKTHALEGLRVAAEYSEGLLRLEQCVLSDARGRLEASGAFRPESGRVVFQARSTIDFLALLHAVDGGEWGDFAGLEALSKEFVFFARPPVLEWQGEANARDSRPGFHGLLTGRMRAGPFRFRGVGFQKARADFSWDGARWFLYDAAVEPEGGGRFALSAEQNPGEDLRFRMESKIDPRLLLPWLERELSPRGREGLTSVKFQEAPEIFLEGQAPAALLSATGALEKALGAVSAAGRFRVGAGSFRGTAIQSASVDLAFQNNQLTCDQIRLKRAEGSGSGTIHYDFNTDILRLVDLRATLHPVEVCNTFDRDLARVLAPYRFKTRPSVVLSGTVGCARRDFAPNNLRIEIEGSGGMDYTFIRKNLPARKVRCVVWVVGDRVKVTKLEADFFSGVLRGEVNASMRKEKGDYFGEMRTMGVDFASLTKLYFGYDDSQGKLTGNFRFSGAHDSAKSVVGKGKLLVTDGNVFAIPILGPLTGVLNKLNPGKPVGLARRGSCDVSMKNGVIRIENLSVEGKHFSMIGGGDLYVLEDKLNFGVQLSLPGAAGHLLNPVGRFLEYTAENPLSKPTWRPKRLTLLHKPKTVQ